MPSAPADLQDSVETAMRAGLARGDGVIAGVGPVLRHLLVKDDRDYVADDILATVRGMIADVARQLAGEDAPDLARALVDVPGLMALAHALACEGQMTRRLRETQGLDPVLSPLMQALIASPRGEMAALAMQVLAAQARFIQHQRRMQWPLAELPAEMLHAGLQLAGDAPRAQALRTDYDEGATRLSLLARLIGQMGAGSVAALDLAHAGVAIFATALGQAREQGRMAAVLSMLSRHVERLVLGLRAGGASAGGVEATLVLLHPGASPPVGLGRIDAERAARLLAQADPLPGGGGVTVALNDPFLARAHSDAQDHLISADEPLAGLQLRCGGVLPGPIAIPELREVVRKARRFGLKLARAVTAQDGHEVIRAWVEVIPSSDGGGCTIILRHWQASPLPVEPEDVVSRRRAEIDRTLAELTARLDERQGLLAVECDGGDLAEVAAAMRAGLGRPWTDFVTIAGSHHHQPLHWRLLDGASVTLAGSERNWRATLIPVGLSSASVGRGGEPAGFDLCLTSDQPASHAHLAQAAQIPAARAIVSNDLAPVLRQPIARIIAHAETIRTRLAGPLSEDYASYAADIASAGQHLMGLVDDLADLEVIEDDTFSTLPDPIDLADAARRAAGILSMRARDKRIVISAPAHEVALPAVAEFRRVLQILLNLIGNAIRYSPEGSTIIVDLSRDEGFSRVAIADQGPGLSVEEQGRIFDKFERLGRSGDGGSGLGLYISRRLARAMGGELSVVSVKGEGACFLLDLPAGK